MSIESLLAAQRARNQEKDRQEAERLQGEIARNKLRAGSTTIYAPQAHNNVSKDSARLAELGRKLRR